MSPYYDTGEHTQVRWHPWITRVVEYTLIAVVVFITILVALHSIYLNRKPRPQQKPKMPKPQGLLGKGCGDW